MSSNYAESLSDTQLIDKKQTSTRTVLTAARNLEKYSGQSIVNLSIKW